MIQEITETLRLSIEYSRSHFNEVLPYTRKNSLIKDIQTIEKSLNFWFNEESINMSLQARKSISSLLDLSHL